jgi:hypothetical protein
MMSKRWDDFSIRTSAAILSTALIAGCTISISPAGAGLSESHGASRSTAASSLSSCSTCVQLIFAYPFLADLAFPVLKRLVQEYGADDLPELLEEAAELLVIAAG